MVTTLLSHPRLPLALASTRQICDVAVGLPESALVRYGTLTVQPASWQVQVAPCSQLISQPPPLQAPIEQVSPAAHSMVQEPPGQSLITRVECSARVPIGAI